MANARSIAGAVAAFVILAAAQSLPHRGLQYDEALMAIGSVQLQNAASLPPVPYDPDTWLCLGERCFPLMTVRYVGALKEYLLLPFVALFGPDPAVFRLISILWAALAVLGAGRLAGPWAAWLLALAPGLASHAAFDNGAVAGWMGALGLCLLFLGRYLDTGRRADLLWLAFSAGLGVWCRANFVWLLVGAAIAAHRPLLRWVRTSPREAGLTIAAGLAGGFPFCLYQAISGFGTLEATAMFRAEGGWAELLPARAIMLARSLLADLEHRAIWGGASLPEWQYGAVSALAALGLFHALRRPGLPRRIAIALLVLLAFLFSSRLPVAEHHFILTLPLFAAALGLVLQQAEPHRARAAFAAYAAFALLAHGQAVRGIVETGGRGQWSDAIVDVRNHLLSEGSGRQVAILDWGLQNNLFVLSGGRLLTVELYDGEDWAARVERGGLFLLNGPANTFSPARRDAFLAAARASGKAAPPREFHERGGAVFAELWDLPPGKTGAGWTLSMAAPGAAEFVEGVHAVEEGAWRWTRRSWTVRPPLPSGAKHTLFLDLFVPAAALSSGPLTLTASANGERILTKPLPAEGQIAVAVPIPSGLPAAAGITFTLNRTLPPTARDSRELGVILRQVSTSSLTLR